MSAMNHFIFAFLLLTTAALGLAGEPAFTEAISPDSYRAAGLDRLTSAERRQLNDLVRVFNAGQVSVAEESARVALEARQSAEAQTKAALAAKQTAEAEARAAKEEAQVAKATDRGFLAKAKVILVPGTKIEYAEIRSTIEGQFEGWNGQTIFRLANGQRWQVVNSGERYFVPPQENVEAAVRPAALGGYWIYFPRLDRRVRVKLLANH